MISLFKYPLKHYVLGFYIFNVQEVLWQEILLHLKIETSAYLFKLLFIQQTFILLIGKYINIKK